MSQTDDDLQEFENAISQTDDADKNDNTVQLVCSVCGKQRFQRIRLFEKRRLRWRPTQSFKTRDDLLRIFIPGQIVAYRCLHCDYVMLFARD